MTTLFQRFNQSSEESLIRLLNSRIEEELKAARLLREGMWSEAGVIGDKAFVCLLPGGNKSRYPGLNVFADGKDLSYANQKLTIRCIVAVKCAV